MFAWTNSLSVWEREVAAPHLPARPLRPTGEPQTLGRGPSVAHVLWRLTSRRDATTTTHGAPATRFPCFDYRQFFPILALMHTWMRRLPSGAREMALRAETWDALLPKRAPAAAWAATFEASIWADILSCRERSEGLVRIASWFGVVVALRDLVQCRCRWRSVKRSRRSVKDPIIQTHIKDDSSLSAAARGAGFFSVR